MSITDAALQRLRSGNWTAGDFVVAVESAAHAPPGSARREELVTAAVDAAVADHEAQKK